MFQETANVHRPSLYVVATPIGNLKDITYRAVEILKSVSLILCEDTRKSRILLDFYGIKTPTKSFHKFNEAKQVEAILDYISNGKDVALISDAGTPGISDPGHRLVRRMFDAGFSVVPIPGPSSISAALSVSGLDCSQFVYLGFVPRNNSEKLLFFEALRDENKPAIFFETPHRLRNTLELIQPYVGQRNLYVFRELTKIHEEIQRGTAESLYDFFAIRDKIKGELVLIVEGAGPQVTSLSLDEIVDQLMGEGYTGRDLADEAKKRFGIPKSAAYNQFLKRKRS